MSNRCFSLIYYLITGHTVKQCHGTILKTDNGVKYLDNDH
jgi:hypothetical protein